MWLYIQCIFKYLILLMKDIPFQRFLLIHTIRRLILPGNTFQHLIYRENDSFLSVLWIRISNTFESTKMSLFQVHEIKKNDSPRFMYHVKNRSGYKPNSCCSASHPLKQSSVHAYTRTLPHICGKALQKVNNLEEEEISLLIPRLRVLAHDISGKHSRVALQGLRQCHAANSKHLPAAAVWGLSHGSCLCSQAEALQALRLT